MSSRGESKSSPDGDPEPTTDSGNLVSDALTVWLSDHPSAAEQSPDLVALLQTLARELEDADSKDVPGLAREYRMLRAGLADGGDDGEEDFAASLRTKVRNAEDAG